MVFQYLRKALRRLLYSESLMRRLLPAVLLALTAGTFSLAEQHATDLNGRAVNPLQSSAGKVVVFIFVRRDCPISGRYAPTIQRLSSEHPNDAHFYLVFPDKADSAAEIRRYLDDFHYSIPAVRDPSHVLVRLTHAQFTPEAAVLDKRGALVYHGRIDDLYVSFGHARSAPTTHELRDAIAAALAGQLPAHEQVAGVGCYISDLE
jgi:thiol-disulfide isomerase/thioredoxin